jgi:CRP-like cAMP-binding protein
VKGGGYPTPCEACPLRARPGFRPFTDAELRFVQAFKIGELLVEAGSDVLLTDNNSAHLFTLLRGWAFRYLILPDGRRQILNIALPGDFLGLQASIFDSMEHSVQALTDVQLCVFPRTGLWSLYSEQPDLAFDVTWMAAHEESMVDENQASVGQRPAVERLAYMILHLMRRLDVLGLVKGDTCDFPLTQQHIADATGLSLVHTNKSLRRLVRSKLLTIGGGRLHVTDRPALEALCGWAPRKLSPRPLI